MSLDQALNPSEMNLISILRVYPGLRRSELPKDCKDGLEPALTRGLVKIDEEKVFLTAAGLQADNIIEEQMDE